MGSAMRRKPVQLAKKLKAIRVKLNLSQNELIRRMGLEDVLSQAHISLFEKGERAPSLPVILQYARAANILVEVLIDDELELPDRLPDMKLQGIKQKSI